jgi:asparagine synthase (glutamine-hydrolysing)
MCGLNGIYAYHSAASSPAERELIATREAMRKRGPDGAGAWWSADRRCALGHRRLAILDLSKRGAQPMISEDGQLVVVFNGEIYNYPALRKELEVAGVRFRTRSDTEVLLHLYARHGAGMLHHLRGMFAFAIWDNQRKGLFLARDLYGIKPLYTANDGWAFRFASQVKALLAGGAVSKDPEPAGLVGFHLFGSVPEPFTLYRGIRALPAGHSQWIDTAGPREPRPYTGIASILAEGANRCSQGTAFEEHIRSAVLDSVRAHLLADVEVGLFLSAGIDSGALLGLMRDAGQNDIRAITLAFEEFKGTPEDEAPSATQVAQRYGANHTVRRVDGRQFRDDLPAILDAMDQPSIDGVNAWLVSKAAKEAGLKVVISGLGGDELFAGYPSFVDVPLWRRRFGLVATLPGVGRLSRLVIKTMAPNLLRSQPKSLGVLQYASSWSGAYLLRRGLHLPYEMGDLLGSELALEGLQRLRPLQLLSAVLTPDPGSDVARLCALESSHYMRNQLLRDADWAGMSHGVEIRVPLVDSALLGELAPAIAGFTPGSAKSMLAQSPRTPLPNEVIERSKTGFGVPTAAWLRDASSQTKSPEMYSKGLTSRNWSQVVLSAALQA